MRGLRWFQGVQGEAGFTGSSTTMNRVATGPRNSDTSHQTKPLLPFAWASRYQ